MSTIRFYGLREARKLVREAKRQMTGPRNDYHRGWKDALKLVDEMIQVRMLEIKENAKP